MPAPASDLMDSYYRCRHDEGFLDTFYELFLATSPAIAEKFAQTDLKMQKLMLRQSLLEMLCFERGISGTRDEIVRLGERHGELQITSDMYRMWVDALCEAIRKHDPEYTLELEQLWRNSLQHSIDEMLAAAHAAGLRRND